MKIYQLIASATLLATHAQACVRLHIDETFDASDRSLTIWEGRLYDNDEPVATASSRVSLNFLGYGTVVFHASNGRDYVVDLHEGPVGGYKAGDVDYGNGHCMKYHSSWRY
ncbi:hypothetical protein FSARC_3069 [Fusarium sarcochroum]|uniref:Uncharacterized protein n=1 Tax=Fusarium sarcochroum TaxID=1208366 RepID=A0A8H4U4I8_9HYPO|nr:hypothetical protein FSARC_3069 [Fusarium sarcochroum]